MLSFTILPMEWDMRYSDKVQEFYKEGKFTPCDIEEVVDKCGNLFPIHTKAMALNYLKALKKEFPFVVFNLFSGSRQCDLELIQEL